MKKKNIKIKLENEKEVVVEAKVPGQFNQGNIQNTLFGEKKEEVSKNVEDFIERLKKGEA
jgi:hypothetical protein